MRPIRSPAFASSTDPALPPHPPPHGSSPPRHNNRTHQPPLLSIDTRTFTHPSSSPPSASYLSDRRSSLPSSAPRPVGQSRSDSLRLRLVVPAITYGDQDEWLRRLGRFDILGEDELTGYQLWAVGDWLTDRDRIMPCMVEFTGNDKDQITVYVLEVSPTVPPEFRVDVLAAAGKMLSVPGSYERQTPRGQMIVVSASSIPSPDVLGMRIPSGDFRTARESIFVTIDLIRMHCSPRAQIDLGYISESTHTNFLQAYCLPFSIYPTPSPRTVLTLVKLIQAALCITSCLNSSADFAIDGLLCRDTMQGLLVWEETVVRDGVVHDWPSGEVVAGLLSSIWAARSKLADMGIDKVPKDPFVAIREFQDALQAFQRRHSIPPSPYLTSSLLQQISNHHSKHAHPHASLSRIIKSTLVPAALASERPAELNTDSMTVFVQNIRDFSKRDRVDSLRFLWLGEGAEPSWDEPCEANTSRRGTVRRFAGKVKGGLSSIATPISRRHPHDSFSSDTDGDRDRHLPEIIVSGQEDTDDSRGRSRPDGAVTPLHLLSSNHSTDHLFPARNGLHTRFSGVPPISGGGSSAAPSSRSADSSRGRLRRTHPGNARPRSLHWDWRDENEEAEDFIRPQRRTKKKPPKRVVREQWFAPGEREAVALRRTLSFSTPEEYQAWELDSVEVIKADMKLYELLQAFSEREAQLSRVIAQYEMLDAARTVALNAVSSELTYRRQELEHLTEEVKQFPTLDPQHTLLSPLPSKKSDRHHPLVTPYGPSTPLTTTPGGFMTDAPTSLSTFPPTLLLQRPTLALVKALDSRQSYSKNEILDGQAALDKKSREWRERVRAKGWIVETERTCDWDDDASFIRPVGGRRRECSGVGVRETTAGGGGAGACESGRLGRVRNWFGGGVGGVLNLDHAARGLGGAGGTGGGAGTNGRNGSKVKED